MLRTDQDFEWGSSIHSLRSQAKDKALEAWNKPQFDRIRSLINSAITCEKYADLMRSTVSSVWADMNSGHSGQTLLNDIIVGDYRQIIWKEYPIAISLTRGILWGVGWGQAR